jgi:hypothetical protein
MTAWWVNLQVVEVPLTAWTLTFTCWKFLLQIVMKQVFSGQVKDQKVQRKKVTLLSGRGTFVHL